MENKPLTKFQKEWIISKFFLNNTNNRGEHEARAIAKILLSEGEAIVAGKDAAWIGGIGNFIKTKNEESLIGCLKHTFDLKTFLESALFKQTKRAEVEVFNEKVESLKRELLEIMDL